MKAPAFWALPKPTLLARALSPLGAIYAALTIRRMKRPGRRLTIPVIAVGNFTVGGAGKTPTAIALARHLIGEGHQPVFISRGYGGNLIGPTLVDPKRHASSEVGDEPLLLAKVAPTIISRHRALAAELAEAHGTVVLLDDALQNPDLVKDITLAVIDGAIGIGNGLCLPAGPLRAPVKEQLPHVSAVLTIGESIASSVHAGPLPTFRGRLVLDETALATLRDRPVIAFAGIGRPEKFFGHMRDAGLNLVGSFSFADHHLYKRRELVALAEEAERQGAELVTTEKDAARLAGSPWPRKMPFHALPVRLEAPEAMAWVSDTLSRLKV